MREWKHKLGVLAPLVGALLLCAASARAGAADSTRAASGIDYPQKYIEFIIPFAPGGGVDLFGRTVAQLLNDQKIVSKPIQVVNKPGAGGSVGMQLMAQRKGDQHRLLGIAIHAVVTPLTL